MTKLNSMKTFSSTHRTGNLPVDLPDPRIEPGSPAFQADSLPSEPPGSPGNNRKVELNALPQVNGEQAHCTARSSSLDENPEDLRSHEIIN